MRKTNYKQQSKEWSLMNTGEAAFKSSKGYSSTEQRTHTSFSLKRLIEAYNAREKNQYTV